MGKSKNFVICVLSFVILMSGCAAVKETTRGILGISTKQLEETRSHAVAKTFHYAYKDCYDRVKKILKGMNTYIYSEDKKKKMIAIYISEADTTPVGIFFTEIDPLNTKIEIASPSTFGRDYIAKKIFAGLEDADVQKRPAVEIQGKQSSALVTIANVHANPGDGITIPISVTDVSKLGIVSVQLDMTYDPSVLTLIDVKNSQLTAHWSVPVKKINPAGASVSLEGNDALSGSGILVDLYFEVSPLADLGTSNIDLLQATFNKGEVSSKFIGGALTLTSPKETK
ncbi:MAG: cohesin domain-containing protein [Candidatus Omnitrophica bacterium]|jgi:hypothetical protein|nr:cohesin domain-containing protein [Candidatus Omnitrophota bacterium]